MRGTCERVSECIVSDLWLRLLFLEPLGVNFDRLVRVDEGKAAAECLSFVARSSEGNLLLNSLTGWACWGEGI